MEVDFTDGARLVARRNGEALKQVPDAVRKSGDWAWIEMTLEAAKQHLRDLRGMLELAMVEQVPLSPQDLAMLALDPAGRALARGLVVRTAFTGRPLLEDWLLETREGDLATLAGPAKVVHPVTLHQEGTLEAWTAWLSRRWVKQPFKQIRRELFLPNTQDRACRTYSDRYAGSVVRWDQARALLEGRGWHRVTKTGAEHHLRASYLGTPLTARVEFRNPTARSFSREDVVLSRIFFLPYGEEPVNRANPGMDIERVPPILFSETVRDVGLAAQVAGRETGGY